MNADFRQLMNSGLLARQQGYRRAAKAVFEAAVMADPDNPLPNLELERELVALGRVDDAEAAFRRVIVLDPNHVGALVALGYLIYRCDGRLDEAKANFKRALEITPNNVGALAGMGHVLRQRGDQEGALVQFEAAAVADPTNIGVILEIAYRYRALGRFPESEAAFQRILGVDPRHVGALIAVGQLRRSRDDRAGALASFEAAAAIDPNNLTVMIDKAHLFREEGRFDDAEAAFRHVIVLDPNHVGALVALGYLVYRCDGRLDEAEANFKRALGVAPNNLGALAGMGHVLRQRGDREGALVQFEAAAVADPTNIGVILEIAYLYRALGRFPESEAAFQRILGIDPRHVAALIAVGQLRRSRGDRAGALASFEAAAAVDPNNLTVMIDKAHLFREEGRFNDAEAAFRHVIVLDRNHVGAWVALGYLYADQFRIDEAQNAFLRAQELDPDNVAAHLGLGHLARRQGDRERSLVHFQSASNIQPDQPITILELAAEYRDLGRFEEARHLIESCIAKRPLDHQAWMHLGHFYRRTSDHELAFDAFIKAAQSQSYNAQAVVEMAYEKRALGDPNTSERLLKEVLDRHPNHLNALIQLAEHARLAAEPEKALQFCIVAISVHPGAIWPYLIAARAAVDAGNRNEASGYLDQAKAMFGQQPEILATEIEVYQQIGDWRGAQDIIDRAPDYARRNFSVWAQHVRIAINTGNFSAAERALSSPPFGTTHDRARIALFRGQLAEAQWRHQEAKSHYQAALTINADDSWAHAEMARVCLLLLDLDDALEHLRSYQALTASMSVMRGLSQNVSQNHLGQILDEFILDQNLVTELKTILSRTPEQQIVPLFDLVRDNPDHTPSAMLLLIAMRRAGRFTEMDSSAGTKMRTGIPNSLIQFWDAEPPPGVQDLMASWRNTHPDFDYALFNDQSAREFLRSHYPREVLSAYVRANEPAQRADIFRLAYLAANGGYYVDADDRCLGRITDKVLRSTSLAVYQENYGTIANNFLGAVPGHPVIVRALDAAVEAKNRGDNDILWLATGPGLLTRAFAQHLTHLDLTRPLRESGVRVFDLGEIQRWIGIHCPLPYKRTERHWSRTAFTKRSRAGADILE